MASSSRLKPGEEGKIVATIDTKGRLGHIAKTVKVYSNDPKKPSINLILKALIKTQPATPSQLTPPPQPSSIPLPSLSPPPSPSLPAPP